MVEQRQHVAESFMGAFSRRSGYRFAVENATKRESTEPYGNTVAEQPVERPAFAVAPGVSMGQKRALEVSRPPSGPEFFA
jgi:hypothetical protein